mgnify:CR=1 FL=1
MKDAERRSGNGTGSSSASRVDDTYGRLRGLIVRGQIAPGSRIIETEVADRLGVSRTPVSAALKRLVQEGVVESDRRNGGHSRRRITPLTSENAHELMYLIGSLEGLAARWVADFEDGRRRRILDDLRALNDRMRSEAKTDPASPAPFFGIDAEFHRAFVEAGGGPRLLRLHESYRPQAERYFLHYVVNQQYSLDRSLEEHEEMIEAMRTGDPDLAENVVQRNWQKAEERLQRAIDRAGERGNW